MDAVKHRAAAFRKISNIETPVKNHATTAIELPQAKLYLEKVREAWQQLETHHAQAIEDAVDAAAEKVQAAAWDPMFTRFNDVEFQLVKIIDALEPVGGKVSSAPVADVRLPAITLPTFNGGPENWISFKDLFKASVDKRLDLAPSQKLHYLKSSLKDDASAVLRSLSITDANYTEARRLLNERYENQREIVYSLVNKLFHQKQLRNESVGELRALLDTTNECLTSLKVIGRPTDKWDDLLVVLVLNKLDDSTRRSWAVSLTGTTLPTFKGLIQFIEGHIRGLQASGLISNSSTSKDKSKDRHVRVHHAAAANTGAQQGCKVCRGHHRLYQCPDFIKLSPKDRNSKVISLKLCFNCFGTHQLKECISTGTCRKCDRKHNTLLHQDFPAQQQSPKTRASHHVSSQPSQHSAIQQQMQSSQQMPSVQGNSASSNAPFQSCHVGTEARALLMTAVVIIQDAHGRDQPCRLFLDPGSQADFISEACANRLGLKRSCSTATITGMGGAAVGESRGQVEADIYSRFGTGRDVQMILAELLVLPKLTNYLPSVKCKREWPHLYGLNLADPEWYRPAQVDLLIGVKHYARIMLQGRKTGPAGSPSALKTIFGWVVAGECPEAKPDSVQSFHVSNNPELEILQRFWETEEPPKGRLLNLEEKRCEEHFAKTHARDETGRFVVEIPFNDRKPGLGYSREAAVRRLKSVEKRLARLPHCQQQYMDFMKEYIKLGHMQEIPEPEIAERPGGTFYLPHHFVLNEGSTTTKLRVVFDGSSKTSTGVSLNDTMMVGATTQDDLYDIILRFRSQPVVIKGDITKMFRQFRLKTNDADLHRILWRDSPDLPIKDFRLSTVTYGTAAATFLSTRCLLQLSRDTSTQYPLASKAIQSSMYVDDLMAPVATTAEAISLYRELDAACKSAGLEMRKWCSNSTELMSIIPDEMKETSAQSFDDDQPVKALGVQWLPSSDDFTFSNIEFDDNAAVTMRTLLADISRVFDPLGLISPLTIRGKLLMQELWKLGLSWDDKVPDFVADMWSSYKDDLRKIVNLTIPRHIRFGDSTSYEIHGFADSSERAYGTVIYIRSMFPNGEVAVSFVTSKTRVAPLKQVSLPRLELCAAVLMSELVDRVKDVLNLDCPIYLWSDSTITLRWISAESRRWQTYVGNRVARIQELTGMAIWRHVPGIENPADLPSRGVTSRELLDDQFWWKGPQWLSSPQLPIFPVPEMDNSINTEERKLPILVNAAVIDLELLSRYSSLSRLQRITAYLKRFLHNIKNPKTRMTGPLTPKELHSSMLAWCRIIQQHHFQDDIISLRKDKQVKSSSKLRSLTPFLDADGTMRVMGRLNHANVPEERKHQIILPSNSPLTTMLVRQFHDVNLHAGFQYTWARLQTQYWIVGGRDKVRHILRACVTCRRYRAHAAEQLMGALPEARVNPCRPFLKTGVDFAGPFTLKNPIGRAPKTYKGYLSLFICMVTKAIHLEPVEALSTEAFIACFRRFAARRGVPAHMYSDCGTNFVGADHELQKLFSSQAANDDIAKTLAGQGITWHFNPPASPHHGGLWEAGVKSCKFHLRRVIGEAVMTYHQFHTILTQVEAVLNSRPLYAASSDPTDFSALTPGHFLIGDALTAVPDEDLENINENRLSLYQLQQKRLQHFWKRWSNDYLHTLQQRKKWLWERNSVKTDDLVLIVEDCSPGQWKMARVQEVHPGKDGNVRVATVRTAGSTFQRSIVKLVPLLSDN